MAEEQTFAVLEAEAEDSRRWRLAVLFVVYIAALIAAWHYFIKAFEIRSYLLPNPADVGQVFTDRASLLADGARITVFEAMVGFFLAVVIGVGLATIIVYSRTLRTILMPSLVALNAAPKVALAPIMIIWLGLGLQSKIAMSFLLSFFPITINTIRGLNDVEPALLEYFQLLKAGRFKTFRKARLPSSLPAMFDGFKISLPIAMIGAVIGEFVASREGIGHQIIIAYSTFDTEHVFAAVITISILSTILFQLLVWTEHRLLSWRPPPQRA